MDFVTIEFDRADGKWRVEGYAGKDGDVFFEGAEVSKLRWDALDFLQRYSFKVIYGEHVRGMMSPPVEGLRFLGVEARWGEFVAATQDQLVLGRPA